MRGAILGLLAVIVLFFGGLLVLLLVWWLLSRDKKDMDSPANTRAPEFVLPPDVGEPGFPVPAGESPGADSVADRTEAVDEEADGPAVVEAEPSAEPAVEEAAPVEPDNLQRIEGIGPKIASVLQAAGISTYAQLANTEVSQLEQILDEDSPRLRSLANSGTWPEQATLAAAGEWDALAALQGTLKRGRAAG